MFYPFLPFINVHARADSIPPFDYLLKEPNLWTALIQHIMSIMPWVIVFFLCPWNLTTSQDWAPLSSCLFSKASTRTNTPGSTRAGQRPCVRAWEVPWKSVELTQNCFSCMKEQEECGWVWERGKSPGGGTDSGLAQTGAYSRDHSASVSSSPLQRLGGEFLWNHTITANITTLWKHNWTDLDRWERAQEGMEFHCWYKER